MNNGPNIDGDAPIGDEAVDADLRKALLTAQIHSLHIQNRRGWWWHMGPALTAILASVAASLILLVFGGQAAKELVAYLDSGVKSARTKQLEIESEMALIAASLEDARGSLSEARAEEAQILGRMNAMRSLEARPESAGSIGISIQIQDKGEYYTLNVDTFPQGAVVSVVGMCSQNFVFPDTVPNLGTCGVQFDVRPRAAPCDVGPIGKMGNIDNSVWVVAELDGEVVYRFVALHDNRIR